MIDMTNLQKKTRHLSLQTPLLVAAMLTPERAAATNAPEHHPAIAAYSGSVLSAREDAGFREHKIVVGVDLKAKEDDKALLTRAVSGTVTRLFYDNPRERSSKEIAANYAEALQRAGFELLFQCAETACTPSWASSRWTRVTGMKHVASDMRFVSARLARSDKEVYVAISVTKKQHQIDIVERTEMDRGLAAITVDALKAGMLAEGRVVLDGVLFDHDKATLKPESKAALDAIAQFLAADPKLKVYIVGHTDGTGTLEHNLALSRDRAAAVVSALIKTYGVKAERLASHGVGPLSPKRTNRNDQGKSENRRVEMVERGG